MKRIATFTIQEILDQIGFGKPRLNVMGHKVKMNTNRLMTFKTDGVVCKGCGIVGSFFSLDFYEKHQNGHLNLYAINEFGHEILMTSDHINPRSNGGSGGISNRQCLCTKCNARKADKIPMKEETS